MAILPEVYLDIPRSWVDHGADLKVDVTDTPVWRAEVPAEGPPGSIRRNAMGRSLCAS